MPLFRDRKIAFGEKAKLKATQEKMLTEEESSRKLIDQYAPPPLLAQINDRRAQPLHEARGALANLPGPGESLHVLCTTRMDLSDIIGALLETQGPCELVRIATLSYHDRNLAAMLGWFDSGAVQRLTLLSSIFFRSHKGDLWRETLAEFRKRGQRCACCHSHAKVVTLAFASGLRFVIEGSANLCGNGSGLEQLCLVNHAELHDWHGTWIDQLVTIHESEGQEKTDGARDESRRREGDGPRPEEG